MKLKCETDNQFEVKDSFLQHMVSLMAKYIELWNHTMDSKYGLENFQQEKAKVRDFEYIGSV